MLVSCVLLDVIIEDGPSTGGCLLCGGYLLGPSTDDCPLGANPKGDPLGACTGGHPLLAVCCWLVTVGGQLCYRGLWGCALIETGALAFAFAGVVSVFQGGGVSRGKGGGGTRQNAGECVAKWRQCRLGESWRNVDGVGGGVMGA